MRVAIVGAGICGLYLAWKLAERGQEVIVFEKREKIGKEACSGLFSERILKFIPESKKLIQNEINFALIHFPRKTLKIRFSSKFLVMSHCQLDRLVFSLAEKAGAKIFLKHPYPGRVKFDQFEKIIGCDGANSLVRKSLGLRNPRFLLGIQGFIREDNYSNFVETWPTKNGFIWKIPRGNEIEYGIIEKPAKAKKLFEEFLPEIQPLIERTDSALIPQGLIIPKNPRITLCGDAAGLCKPWSGGGVIWGLIAANLLLKNFPDFLKYQKALKKFFLSKIIFSKMITKTVYFLGYRFPWIFPKNIEIDNDFLISKR